MSFFGLPSSIIPALPSLALCILSQAAHSFIALLTTIHLVLELQGCYRYPVKLKRKPAERGSLQGGHTCLTEFWRAAKPCTTFCTRLCTRFCARFITKFGTNGCTNVGAMLLEWVFMSCSNLPSDLFSCLQGWKDIVYLSCRLALPSQHCHHLPPHCLTSYPVLWSKQRTGELHCCSMSLITRIIQTDKVFAQIFAQSFVQNVVQIFARKSVPCFEPDNITCWHAELLCS